MYGYYRFLVWLEGPKRRRMNSLGESQRDPFSIDFDEDEDLFGPSSTYPQRNFAYSLDLMFLSHQAIFLSNFCFSH